MLSLSLGPDENIKNKNCLWLLYNYSKNSPLSWVYLETIPGILVCFELYINGSILLIFFCELHLLLLLSLRFVFHEAGCSSLLFKAKTVFCLWNDYWWTFWSSAVKILAPTPFSFFFRSKSEQRKCVLRCSQPGLAGAENRRITLKLSFLCWKVTGLLSGIHILHTSFISNGNALASICLTFWPTLSRYS